MNEKDCDEMVKKGDKEIKSGFFKSPDYVSGVGYFTDAAKGYRKFNLDEKSLMALSKAFECNGKISDFWSAGRNAQEMAEICIFNLNNFNQGLGYLKNASYNFKVGGKFTTSIKAYSDISQKLIEKQNYQGAERILQVAFDDCLEHPEDPLIRISQETVYSNLLDIMCRLEHYPQAIKINEDLIKVQLDYEENKYKVSKNYIKSAMLRIIIDEGYLVKDIVNKMYQLPYNDVHEDIADIQKLAKAIETVNKKDFNFCIQYAFSLFENNLLKGIQKVYEKKEKEMGPMIGEIDQIVVQELMLDNVNNINNTISNDETKVSIQTESHNEMIEDQEDNNNKNDFL